MAQSSHLGRHRFARWSSVLSAAVFCVACGSSKDPPAATRACTPGEQRACACPAGNLGVQICNNDGSALGACMGCAASSTGGASGTAATTTLGTNPSGGSTGNATGSTFAGQSGGTNLLLQGGATSVGGASATGGSPATGATTALTTAAGSSTIGGAAPLGGYSNTVDTGLGGGTMTAGGSDAVGGAMPTGGAAGAPQTSTGGMTAAGGVTGIGSTGGSSVVSSCGNGIVDGTESCDPAVHNNDLGDGCTPTCHVEPTCPVAGGTCTTTCGDGFAQGGEACDDGNAVGGDGCSADCQVESGFTCAPSPAAHLVQVPLVVRDFSSGGDFEKGGSFALELDYANQGLLNPLLDPTTLKPSLLSTTGTYNGKSGQDSGIATASSFAQWFDDKAPAAGNTYHATLATTLNLYLSDSDPAVYVNRYGNNGDGLTDAQYQRSYFGDYAFCGQVGYEDKDANGQPIPCTYCIYDTDTSTPQCDPGPAETDCTTRPPLYCVQQGSSWYGVYIPIHLDGNPLFFPADGVAKPWSPDASAVISGNYDGLWPSDPAAHTHNFSFTTEVRFWFKYDAAQAYTLSFTGDDDSWVFVNKHLALDMGGIHLPVQGTLTISNGQVSTTITNTLPEDSVQSIKGTPDLGTLEDGGLYEVAVFQAERQTKGSSYGLSVTPNFLPQPSACQRTP